MAEDTLGPYMEPQSGELERESSDRTDGSIDVSEIQTLKTTITLIATVGALIIALSIPLMRITTKPAS